MSESWCRVCGKKYKVCDRCETQRMRTPWRIITDTAIHYQIYVVVSQYNRKLIDKEKAKEMLSNIPYDKDEVQNFIPAVRDRIEEITREDPVTENNNQTGKNENVSNVSKKTRRRGRTKQAVPYFFKERK